MDHKCMVNKVLGLNIENFRSREFIDKIQTYGSFLSSGYGPYCNSYIFTNTTGISILANSSLNICENFRFSHPAIKFINAFIDAQNERFGLFGSYLGIICCGLLHEALQISHIPWYQVQLVADKVFCLLKAYLENEMLQKKLDIGNFNEVLKFTRTILFSKNDQHCLHDCNDVVIAVVKCFILTTPTGKMQNFGNIYVLPIEQYCETKVVPGLCLYQSELTRTQYYKLKCSLVVKILIFNIPIASDVSEGILLTDSNTKSILRTHYANILKGMLDKWKVDVIFCQKYICEDIKFDLERSGFMVFERLGLGPTCSLLEVARCLPISTLTDLDGSINEKYIGLVSLSVEELKEKYILIVQNPMQNSNVTLIISETVTTGGNIKKHVESCLKILRLTITNPYVVPGGGCFEASCTLALLKMKVNNIGQIADDLKVSITVVKKVIGIFMKVFLDLSIAPTRKQCSTRLNYAIDLETGHLWKSQDGCFNEDTMGLHRCVCGMIDKTGYMFTLEQLLNYDSTFLKTLSHFSLNIDNFYSVDYLDYYPAKYNAISLAFNAFVELFNVALCIHDNV